MIDQLQVLDHGYVKLRNLAGPTRRTMTTVVVENPSSKEMETHSWDRRFDADDTDVANAARLSFEGQDQNRTYDDEMKLTKYLMQHRHMTPFESIEVWLEMKLPIFVARQFVRQRTQSINEASARYIALPEEWYIPEIVGGKPPKGGAKQGQVDNLPEAVQIAFKKDLAEQCALSYQLYKEYLANGVAPEHARFFLHVNHYTHWMTKMNLRNLLISFLSLRDDPHAQIEAQWYAQATIKLMDPHLPGLMQLYRDLIKS